MMAQVDLGLFIAAAVLLVAVAAVRWSTRFGVPSLLIYLGIGVLLGESFLGVPFDDVELARVLGTCALVLIIAEGGLTARWSRMRPVLGVSVRLATLGILISVVVVAVSVHLVLGWDWRTAILIGAVLSSTDAAAVFSTLRRMRIRPRIASTLEAESGMNDPMAVLLVVVLSDVDTTLAWWQNGLLLGYQLAGGAAIGLAAGAAGAWLLRRAALPAAGLYPLAVVGLAFFAYAAGAFAHVSGFLAVYLASVVLGNARLPHRQAVLGFADGVAWLAQIGLFIMLGLLVSPAGLPAVLVPALIVGAVLTFLARPISVLVCASWRRRSGSLAIRAGWPWREQAFLSWAGLRGAVPIVFAMIPLAQQLPGAEQLFNVVFVLVVVFTLMQASTLPRAARLLRVTAPAETTEIMVETAPLTQMRADLLQLDVPAGSRLAGVHLDELRLPVGAAVTLVLRDGQGFVPTLDTRLRTGDNLLIVATDSVREEAEQRLRAVSRKGRLARWFGEAGVDRSGAVGEDLEDLRVIRS